MIEPQTIYTTPWAPDMTRAEDVLAFLLMPEAAFLGPDDCAGARAAVHETLNRAKRDALLHWYETRRMW